MRKITANDVMPLPTHIKDQLFAWIREHGYNENDIAEIELFPMPILKARLTVYLKNEQGKKYMNQKKTGAAVKVDEIHLKTPCPL